MSTSTLTVRDDAASLLCDDVVSLVLVYDDVVSLVLVCDDAASLVLVCDDAALGESGMRSIEASGGSGMRAVDGCSVCFFENAYVGRVRESKRGLLIQHYRHINTENRNTSKLK